jgi:3'(2'), 5'-bisphosphate nucleotidase
LFIGSDSIAMGSLRLSTWAGPSSAQRGFLPAGPASEWRPRRRRRASPSAPVSASASASLGAGRLRTGREQEWLWDCRGGLGGSGWGGRDYAREMDTAVRVVQLACTLCQRVQGSLLRPSPDAGGRVHAKLDQSPVTVAGS